MARPPSRLFGWKGGRLRLAWPLCYNAIGPSWEVGQGGPSAYLLAARFVAEEAARFHSFAGVRQSTPSTVTDTHRRAFAHPWLFRGSSNRQGA